MAGYGGGAGVEPGFVSWRREVEGDGIILYQSMDWGGSSLEGEVLTVSTQPV